MDSSIKIESDTDTILIPINKELKIKPSNVDTTDRASSYPTKKRVTSKTSKTGLLKRKQKFVKNLSYVHKPEKEEFTLYLKKRFLNFFCEKGCTPEALALCLNTYNVNPEEVIEYFNKASKEAQQYIHQECDSLSFNNINEWLRYMQTIEAAEECNYEAAIVTNAIANNEQFPPPEKLGGIDLKSVYKYLSSALMGLPLPALDPASAKFLSNEFKNLINVANTDDADIDVQNMKTKIEFMLNTTGYPQATSLDSLNLSDDIKLVVDNSTETKYTNRVKTEK